MMCPTGWSFQHFQLPWIIRRSLGHWGSSSLKWRDVLAETRHIFIAAKLKPPPHGGQSKGLGPMIQCHQMEQNLADSGWDANVILQHSDTKNRDLQTCQHQIWHRSRVPKHSRWPGRFSSWNPKAPLGAFLWKTKICPWQQQKPMSCRAWVSKIVECRNVKCKLLTSANSNLWEGPWISWMAPENLP